MGKKKGGKKQMVEAGPKAVWLFFLGMFCLAAALAAGGVLSVVRLGLPAAAGLRSYRAPEASFVLDRRGGVIGEFHDEFRINVPLADMPAFLPLAFVAAEDARFFSHPGFDVFAVIRAVIRDIAARAPVQGGSTITMQVARMLMLSREKTFSRKLRELFLAWQIDRNLSKKKILEIYLNQIYLGEGAYGVEAAALTYFNKHVRDLNLAEAAMLAGLPQAPSRYSPRCSPELARRRQRYVLNRMAAEGMISAAAAREAFVRTVRIMPSGPEFHAGPGSGYFAAAVAAEVRRRFGADILKRGGLRIYTTMDPELEDRAAAAVRKGVRRWRRRHPGRGNAPQAALVAVDNATGRVLALVGGLDFAASPFNRALEAKRQPGSGFKPFVYAAAFNHGFSPDDVIDDSPVSLPGRGPGEVWRPENFSGRFYGPTSLRDALVHSRNVVTVKLLRRMGIEPLRLLAARAGLDVPDDVGLSIALGTAETDLLGLTRAYTAFANGGMMAECDLVTRVEDGSGRVLWRFSPRKARVMPAGTAELVRKILQDAVREGTGRAAGIPGEDVAGKTGTSDGFKDAWFIGFTSRITCGVWLGFDNGASLGEGESGGRLAAPVWRDFMAGAGAAGGASSPAPMQR